MIVISIIIIIIVDNIMQIGGSHVPFCPPSPVKDKKGQNGHKNTKNGKK